MKLNQIFLIFIIGAILLVCGCIGGSGGTDATPTPYVAVTHVPTINHPATSTPEAAVSTGPVSYFDINGTVYSSSGIAEANAVVTLWRNNVKVAIDGVTNPQFSGDGTTLPLGKYYFKNIPKDTYKITADKDGYETSVFYDGYNYMGSDLWLTSQAVPSKLAGPTANTGGYVCTFQIERNSNGDVVITNAGGSDAPYVQAILISFTDNTANTVGPDTVNNLQSKGVSGTLQNMGDSCTIAKASIATYSHVVVYAVFNKPPADVTSKLAMNSADV
jgi:hypothetical protein